MIEIFRVDLFSGQKLLTERSRRSFPQRARVLHVTSSCLDNGIGGNSGFLEAYFVAGGDGKRRQRHADHHFDTNRQEVILGG